MTAPLPIEVRAVALEQIIDLRHQVLRFGMPRETAYFSGDNAPDAIHLAAFLNGQIVGCATLHRNSYRDQPAHQLRGMAVQSVHQRHGVGKLLLLEVDRLAAESAMPLLWANCRTPAVPFYRALGWQIDSDEFKIETAGPHFRMVKVMRG